MGFSSSQMVCQMVARRQVQDDELKRQKSNGGDRVDAWSASKMARFD